MHHSFLPEINTAQVGDRIVVENSYPGFGLEILRVTKIGRGEFEAVDSKGRTYNKEEGSLSVLRADHGKAFLKWTLPLPELPESEAIEFLSAIFDCRNAPALLHIREINTDYAKAKLVFSWRDDESPLIDGEDSQSDGFTWRSVGNARIMDADVVMPVGKLPAGTGTMDLVIAPEIRCDIENGQLITTPTADSGFRSKISVAGKNVPEADLGRYVPFRERQQSGNFHNSPIQAGKFFDASDFAEEAHNAKLRTEPDEALVLWLPDERKEGDTFCCFLSSRGYLFAVVDSPADYFWDANVAPGVWLCSGAKMWTWTSYEGEHDSGIDADWVPATADDLERFGFDMESLSTEIAALLEDSGLDVETADGLSDEWIKKAQAAADAERKFVVA